MANQFGDCSDLVDYLSKRTKLVGKCVLFTNRPNSCGYGVLAPCSYLAKMYNEKLLHRLVWAHYNGKIPDNMCIMHTCDNRMCVNIQHPQLGTWADNNKDRAAKGRNGKQKGEAAARVTLNNKKVLLIRDLQGEFSCAFLAEFFNVHPATICYIWKRKLWRHI